MRGLKLGIFAQLKIQVSGRAWYNIQSNPEINAPFLKGGGLRQAARSIIVELDKRVGLRSSIFS